MTVELTVCVPSRSEIFLARTIQDILEHSSEKTEVIAVLDGEWADPGVVDHERVILVKLGQSVGQRAATNIAAKMARGKYVMKTDAHCAFSPGFDEILLADMQPDWALVPVMRNLWVFDWVCPNGHRRYQGPSGVCTQCGEQTTRDIVWVAKNNPQSTSYCFDSTPHFLYFKEYTKRPEYKAAGDLTETMSLQGSCWMVSKENYFRLDLGDESYGIWGSQGVQVACSVWLSGGKVMVSHKCFYSHMFRTQGFDFSFPYELSGKQVEYAKAKARDALYNNKFPHQIYPSSWLIEKFAPVPGWSQDDLHKIQETGKAFI